MEKLELLGSIDLSAVLSFILVLFLSIKIYQTHTDKKNYPNFDVIYLFCDDDGKINGSKFRLTVVFIVMSWAFIYQTMKGNLTEWYVLAYAGAFLADRISSRTTEVKKDLENNKSD